MNEHPVLFDGESVRAILAGHKTQTRRIVFGAGAKRPGYSDNTWDATGYDVIGSVGAMFRTPWTADKINTQIRCPYGTPGDRLWGREAHAIVPATAYRCSSGVQVTVNPDDSDEAAVYRQGWARARPGRWRPPLFMPRWAARILLAVTDVRVERLQAISEADAEAEGVDVMPSAPAALNHRTSYARRWDAINGKRAPWASDPWVWVVDFEVCDVS